MLATLFPDRAIAAVTLLAVLWFMLIMLSTIAANFDRCKPELADECLKLAKKCH